MPKQDDQGQNAGSIQRLRWWLESTPASADVIDKIVGPLRTVRAERQKPAHALIVAQTDATLTAQQRDLLQAVAGSLHLLRQVLEAHPKARDTWKAPEHLDDGANYLL